MEKSNLQFNIKHLAASFASGVIVGGAIIGLSTALYLISKNGVLPNNSQNVVSTQYKDDQRPGLPIAPAMSVDKAPIASSEPSQSGPFINTDVPVVIPKDTPIEKAKEVLLSELKKLPSIKIGEGENDIYVLFDPLCTHCHAMYTTFISKGASKKYNLVAHFIPARVFFDKQASLVASLYMNDLLLNGKPDQAKKYLESLIARKPLLLEETWKPSEKATQVLDRSTMALLQVGGGTPLVIFRNKNTHELETVSGEPDDTDYNDMGAI